MYYGRTERHMDDQHDLFNKCASIDAYITAADLCSNFKK